MAKQHDKQFKIDAPQYYEDHKELSVHGCVQNLGTGYSTLTNWLKDFREPVDSPVRGSGNYASDEQKSAHPKRELRDAQDALDISKKAINILVKWKKPFIPKFLKRRKLPRKPDTGFRFRNAEIFRCPAIRIRQRTISFHGTQYDVIMSYFPHS